MKRNTSKKTARFSALILSLLLTACAPGAGGADASQDASAPTASVAPEPSSYASTEEMQTTAPNLSTTAAASENVSQEPSTAESVTAEDSSPATEPSTPAETVAPEPASLASYGLPILSIQTENNREIASKDVYINATMNLTPDEDSTVDIAAYAGDIQIKGRGNSTWMAAKKPYKIKLSKKTDLLNSGKNKHYVLLANYYDSTLMRNDIAFSTAKAMGFPAMDGVHVSLYLNGEYQGDYMLCEHLRVDPARLDIHDWEDDAADLADTLCEAHSELKDASDQLEGALTKDLSWMSSKTVSFNGQEYDVSDFVDALPARNGGFLLELDDTYDEVSKFKTKLGQPIMVSGPEYAKTDSELWTYIQTYVQAVEDAITSPDFTTEYEGRIVSYQDLVNVDSFVDFFLLTEVFANLDSMFKSTFMYKDVDGLLTMGPIWDFDLCAGGSMVIEFQPYYERWQTTYRSLSKAQGKQWYRYLIRDPEFVQRVYDRYHELRDTVFADLLAQGGLVDRMEALLTESGAANLSMWNASGFGGFGGFGGWGQNPRGGNSGQKKPATPEEYKAKVDELRSWLTKRFTWLDAQMQDMDTLTKSLTH
ncbi:MAG: CotH kinase family protein [Lachnospiraceae bacterium]|nr:CotH kinase family protein [Lachnospiraceae bacterium]